MDEQEFAKQIAEACGRRIRKLRLAAGLTQAELAELAGLRSYIIGRYEQGNQGSIPDHHNISKIASIFGVATNWLLSPQADQEPIQVDTSKIDAIKARQYFTLALRHARVPESRIPGAVVAIESLLHSLIGPDQ